MGRWLQSYDKMLATLLAQMDPHQVKNMPLEEFCAAALNVFYLEGKANWGERANLGYDFFNASGNQVVTRAQVAKVRRSRQGVLSGWALRHPPTPPSHFWFRKWGVGSTCDQRM